MHNVNLCLAICTSVRLPMMLLLKAAIIFAEKVNETMLEMGVPETMPSYMSMGIKPVFQEAYQNGGCKITCNGKPAWFKGQFPCFGTLKVRHRRITCSCHIDVP